MQEQVQVQKDAKQGGGRVHGDVQEPWGEGQVDVHPLGIKEMSSKMVEIA